ncbi:MAG: hypothetical protein SGILL_002413 [Bacillariaceae sp.]
MTIIMCRSSSTDKKGGAAPPSRKMQSFAAAVILLAAFLFVWIGSENQVLLQETTGLQFWSSVSKADHQTCAALCEERKAKPQKNKYYGRAMDLLDTTKMLQKAERAKKFLLEDLQKLYGAKHFDAIFKEGDHYRPFANAFEPDKAVSMERLKRKLMIKLLKVKAKVIQHESSVNGMCDCWDGKNKAIPKRNDALVMNDGDLFEKYVWATGGHSASAGHGNLFNETYTAFLELDLVEVFGSVGIEFIGRNHAMGGTPSNGEIAMCFEQVFGSDVDIFSWDYGMTDGGKNNQRFLHYAYRGGLSQGRPVVVALNAGGRSKKSKLKMIRDLEEMGMAGFLEEEDLIKKMKVGTPDSSQMKEKDLLALPDYVRNLKCGDQIEKGDPFCASEKFNNALCSNRGKQTSWHPGWKAHALTGRGVSLFLTQALIEALKSLVELKDGDDNTLLTRLQEEDDALFSNFTSSPFPASEVGNLLKFNEDDKDNKDFDVSQFLTGSNFCRTGRLPAQARFLGYMFEDGRTGGPAPTGQETYEVGISDKEVKKNAGNGTTMRLARETQHMVMGCPVTVHPDSKDAFYANALDDWTTLTLPNQAERQAYDYDPSNFKGLFLIYFIGCDWGKCEKGLLKEAELKEKKWEMRVNGKQVKEIKSLGFEASIAQFEDGIHVAPNSQGVFDVEIKIHEKDSFVKISGFVII